MGDMADEFFERFFDDPFDIDGDDGLYDEQSGRGVYYSPRGLDAGIDRADPVWVGTEGPIRVAESDKVEVGIRARIPNSKFCNS